MRYFGALLGWNQSFSDGDCCLLNAKNEVVPQRRLRLCQAAQEQRFPQFQLYGATSRLRKDPWCRRIFLN